MAKKPSKRRKADILRLSQGQDSENRQFLSGHLLIAMPGIDDERFSRTVVYLCAHSEEGAMGLIINRPMDDVDFESLVEQLEVHRSTTPIQFVHRDEEIAVLDGGPVETGRGFVLHTPDYYSDDSTLEIDGHFSLTTTLDVLSALAEGSGPRRALLTLGYAGWGPGQLEAEIQNNGWLHCEADSSLVFGSDHDMKYTQALSKLGIKPGMLSLQAGHG